MHSGNGAGGFSNTQTHSPTTSAFIAINGSGFSSVGRTFHLKHPGQCGATVWVNPATNATTLNIEVINPVTFTYLALSTVSVQASQPFTQFGLGWTGPQPDVLVRVSLLGNSSGLTASAWVDDFVIGCQTPL